MIPLKIETLLQGQVVEQNRIEYKEGWNPDPIIHTICAYANDYNNVNGGYLVIGVKAEKGLPLLPPTGIPLEDLDKIQQEIFQYCNQIQPRYIPKIEVIDYQDSGIHLLYLWCPAGDNGPYQAPDNVYIAKGQKDGKRLQYWIRPTSLTTAASQDEVAELFDKFNSIPYDDRVNRKATIKDIHRGYVEDFLRDSDSSLIDEINTIPLKDLLLSLEVANDTDTDLAIRNIGVLMFTERPEKFIPGAQIDLVKFDTNEAEGSDDFIEKTFYGPIWKQVRDVLDYINTNVLEEKVIKIQGQAESVRYFNYPYNALEEAVVNAVFHKSYQEPEPVEIRIYVDSIVIINYPGLARWVKLDKFIQGKERARKYRNRRIGEMFKELELSEKQGTGITKILRELDKNGSPKPEFEMDDDRHYLETTIHIRDGFEPEQHIKPPADENEGSLKEVLKEVLKEADFKKVAPIIEAIDKNGRVSPAEAKRLCGKSESTTWRYLKLLKSTGYVEPVGNTNNVIYKRKVN